MSDGEDAESVVDLRRIIKTSYYSPARRKQFHKQVQLKKFALSKDPLQAAQDALAVWKDEQKRHDAGLPLPEGARGSFEPETMELEPFNLDCPDFEETGMSCVLYGSSKSGKSYTLVNQVATDPRIIDPQNIVFVISDSLHSATYMGLPSSVIKIGRWEPRLIPALAKIQKKTRNKYRFIILIDDIVGHRDDPWLKKAILVLRNSRISTFICLQSTQLLSKTSRGNINGCIFHHLNNDEEREGAIKRFLGSFKPFYGKRLTEQVRLYEDMTSDRKRIYLDTLNGELHHIAP